MYSCSGAWHAARARSWRRPKYSGQRSQGSWLKVELRISCWRYRPQPGQRRPKISGRLHCHCSSSRFTQGGGEITPPIDAPPSTPARHACAATPSLSGTVTGVSHASRTRAARVKQRCDLYATSNGTRNACNVLRGVAGELSKLLARPFAGPSKPMHRYPPRPSICWTPLPPAAVMLPSTIPCQHRARLAREPCLHGSEPF